jgi:hypothetical protein
MRAIQAGILICLLAISGLLFAIYNQQAEIRAAAESEVRADAVAAQADFVAPAPIEAAPPEPAPEPPPRKPTPVLSQALAATPPKPAARPAATIPAPEPEAEPAVAEQAPADAEPAAIIPPGLPEPPEIAETPPEFAEPLLEEPEPEAAPEPREPRIVTLPAGQRLTVRLDNTLSTSRNRVDDTFFATLDEPVIVGGLIIADKGARLEGRVVESEQAGRVKGLARLVCELTRMHTDDGQRVEIATSTFALDGPESRNDDLKKVAVGAGAGAILGAVFGGGKGAAIGAASGAGAGAGAAAATRGEPAVIEPETRLDFRLTEGVRITERL